MIEEIELENFKAFGEKQTISLAPLTLIYGQNSAGKSSIIQSLALMKQSMEADREVRALKPFVNGGLVDLGSYRELLHEQNLANKFAFSFVSWMPRPLSYLSRLSSGAKRRETKTRLCFDSIKKDQIPFLEKVSQKVFESGRELLSFDLEVIKKRQHAKSVRENDYVDYKVSGLKFSSEFLKDKFNWLVDNFEIVKKYRENWIKGEISYSEAEMPEDFEAFRDHLLEKTKFYEKKPTFSAFKKYLSSTLENQKFQLAGFELEYRPGSFRSTTLENSFFELDIPFGEKIKSSETDLSAVQKRRFRFMRRKYSDLNFSRSIESAFHHLGSSLERSVFLGPIRSHPSRFYASGGITPQTVGYSGERTPDLIQNDTTILKETNDWLEKLEMGYQIEPQKLSRASLFELSLRDLRNTNDKSFRVTLKDVGFGVSQVLPIIVQCIFSDHDTILIEQPELHIHPRLQADLADLFIYSMTERGNRLIIETHSEHLVLRLAKQLKRREEVLSDFPAHAVPELPKFGTKESRLEYHRKREKHLEKLKNRREKISCKYDQYTPDPILFDSDKLLVNYVSRGETTGSKVHKIGFTEDGKFKDKWPGGFFPERRREIIF